MIPHSQAYKDAVFAPSRQINARATITMDAFAQSSPQVIPWTTDYSRKITASTVECPHTVKYSLGSTLLAPSSFSAEASQSHYDGLIADDSSQFSASTAVNGSMRQVLFSFDIVRALEDKFGKNIWNGKTLLADKIVIAKQLVTSWEFKWLGRGSSPLGNKAYISVYSSVWGTTKSHTGSSHAYLSIPSTSSTFIQSSSGLMHFNAYADASDGVTSSFVATDYVSLELTVTQTTTRTFYDDKIVSANALEEVSILNLTSPSNQLLLTMDNSDGLFDFLKLNNMYTILASNPRLSLEFAMVLEDGVTEEWIQIGTFFMDAWKNNTGNMTITFTAHDLLYRLSNTSFPETVVSNAHTATVAVLTNAGITDYYIDPIIATFNGGNRKTKATNSRQLLQNLAIVTGCTFYQNRYGQIRIEKFPDLQQSSTYLNFTTTQSILGGGYSMPTNYTIQSTDGGMRVIGLEAMFDLPEVTLDQSIYQLQINVYKTNPDDDSYTTYVYTNTALAGNSGESFSIDIQLVQSEPLASAIAQRMFNETKYNAVYVTQWRQNPVLEATDVIIMRDSESTSKQTRVTKQEFNYEGYLRGTTESRGGI